MKTCFKCKIFKPLSEFYKHSAMKDGCLGKCKDCTKADVKNRYLTKGNIIREYERRRFKDPKRKRKILEYQRKSRQVNAQKWIARYSLSNAIRDGRLEREPCKICGETRSQAHHHDYSKPFDVDWLCFKHHREMHGQRVN